MAKIIKCPKCGAEFKKPIFGQKRIGIGLGFTALGDKITCPKCDYQALAGEYEVVGK